MNNMSIRQKIAAGFGAILLVLLAICAFGFISIERISEHAGSAATDTLPGLRITGKIKDALAEDYALSAAIIGAAKDPRIAFKAKRAANEDKLRQQLAAYDATIVQEADRQLFNRLQRDVEAYLQAQIEAELPDEVNVTMMDSSETALFLKRRHRVDGKLNAVMSTAQALADDNYLTAKASIRRVQGELVSLERMLLITIAIAIAVAVGAGNMLRQSILPPLRKLGALMDMMRQGDFTQRMTIERRDEFGDLADGFNRMADEVMGLVSQVQKSGIRVSTSMTEIAATSKQQQATATEVAATTTEIGATSREISATSRELVRTMSDVASVAENAAELAASGQTGLKQMETTMSHVMEAGASINAKLAVLNEKAGNINQIVTTITKVADQINLLSLNAAIEAEKAGEYGRGFAVVSSEIRRLADQTAVATYDIEETVKEIQSAVSAGVMGMDKFSAQVREGMEEVQQIGGNLSDVIDLVQTLVPRFETVNDGMQAQATGAEQISEALLQLTEATQQTVESLRQSSAAIDDLNQVSGNLHSSISRFKLAAA